MFYIFCLQTGFSYGDNSGGGATAAASSSSLSGPVFLKEPANRIDFSNTTGTVVECAATGNPRPEIVWIKSDGTPVTDVPGLRQVFIQSYFFLNLNSLKKKYFYKA